MVCLRLFVYVGLWDLFFRRLSSCFSFSCSSLDFGTTFQQTKLRLSITTSTTIQRSAIKSIYFHVFCLPPLARFVNHPIHTKTANTNHALTNALINAHDALLQLRLALIPSPDALLATQRSLPLPRLLIIIIPLLPHDNADPLLLHLHALVLLLVSLGRRKRPGQGQGQAEARAQGVGRWVLGAGVGRGE